MDLVKVEEVHGLCAFGVLKSLGKAPEFNTHCKFPNFVGKGICNQLLIFIDPLFCDRMYNAVGNLINCIRIEFMGWGGWAKASEAVTSLRIAHGMCILPLSQMGSLSLGKLSSKKYPPVNDRPLSVDR